jgi:hypothetical protein
MGTAADLLKNYAPYAADAFLRRRAASSATRRLTSGVDAASDLTRRTGADMRNLYQPYVDAGTTDLGAIQTGLQPGGGLADPFKFDQTDYMKDPGYLFTKKQGEDAIAAAANAGGYRFSGATLKDIAGFNQDLASTHFDDVYKRNENTFRQNQADRFNRLKGIVDTGATATSESGRAEQLTGAQLAELLTDRATAEAAGDVEKANAITDAISGIVSNAQDKDILNKILNPGVKPASSLLPTTTPSIVGGPKPLSLVPGVEGSAPPLAAPSLPGAAFPGAVTSAAAFSPGAAVAPGALAIPAAPTGLIGAPGAVTTGGIAPGGGGISSTVTGFLTNPVTIGVAAAIIGVTALLKSQAHWEANTFVKSVQNPFGQQLGRIVDGFNAAARAGQLDRGTAQQMRGELTQQLAQFEQARTDFARKGKDNAEVARNAKATMDRYYGVNFSKLLSDLDSTIAQLPA